MVRSVGVSQAIQLSVRIKEDFLNQVIFIRLRCAAICQVAEQHARITLDKLKVRALVFRDRPRHQLPVVFVPGKLKRLVQEKLLDCQNVTTSQYRSNSRTANRPAAHTVPIVEA